MIVAKNQELVQDWTYPAIPKNGSLTIVYLNKELSGSFYLNVWDLPTRTSQWFIQVDYRRRRILIPTEVNTRLENMKLWVRFQEMAWEYESNYLGIIFYHIIWRVCRYFASSKLFPNKKSNKDFIFIIKTAMKVKKDNFNSNSGDCNN